jgi:hypothetical protein
MKATVFDEKRGLFQVEIDELTHRLSTDSFFWLDIDGASAEELQTVISILQNCRAGEFLAPALRTAGQIRGRRTANPDLNICRWSFRSAN